MEPQKRRKVYSQTQLAEAIKAINEGTSVYEASKRFNVPKTTLRDKRDAKYKNEICGVQPVLNLSEEKQIVDWIHYLGKMGFPVTKEQLLEAVAKLVQNLNRPNPFKNGVPGRYWFENFIKRHPTVSKRVAQNLPSSRNQVTEAAIRAWFDRVNNYFMTNNLHHVLEDPRRVFNCDETAFFLCPKEKEVLVSRGSKRVYNRVANDEKECLTVLVNVSADGSLAPPMILFPYKRLPKNLVPTLPRGWGLGNTESGWMNTEAFYEYVTNCFYPWLVTNEIPFPVVLFLDGHTSHISLPLSTFCKEKAIILIALLPNSTHILQPLDVAVFRPVKGTWRTIVHEFRIQNNYAKLKRTDFASAVKKCFDQCLKPETIKSGFRCCGLYPFDPSIINYSKLLPNLKHTEDINHITTSEYAEKFKHDFEARLSPITLQTFKDSGGQWMGDPTYKKLYEYWKKITTENAINQESGSILQLGESTINNNFVNETPDISEAILNFDIAAECNLILPIEQGSEVLGEEASNLSLFIENPLPLSPTVNLLTVQDEFNQFPQTSTPQQDYIFLPSTNELTPLSTSILAPENNNLIELTAEPLQTLQKYTPSPKNVTKEAAPKTSGSSAIPTPFKNYATPFKNSLYFPKNNIDNNKKKTLNKKLTPTVAISDEFMEYQRRIIKEKEDKENKKLKRKQEILEKREQKELLKKTTTLKKKKPIKKVNAVNKEDSPIAGPSKYQSDNEFDFNLLPKKAAKRRVVCNSELQTESTKGHEHTVRLLESDSARETVKRRVLYSSESDDDCIFK